MTDYRIVSDDNNIWFTGVICRDSIIECQQSILEYNKRLLTFHFVSCDGGSTTAALTLLHFINKINNQKFTINFQGLNCSAATSFLFTKHKVTAYSNAIFLFHDTSYYDMEGSIKEIKNKLVFVREMEKQVDKVYYNLPFKYKGLEIYKTAQQLLDYNIIKEIV